MNKDVITLKTVFADSKQELSDSLKGLSLPKDSSKIESIVTAYLQKLFENEGGFRQNLTEAEDYVLQSVLRLLQSQQEIAKEIAKTASETDHKQATISSNEGMSLNPYIAVAGAGAGAVAGGLFSTWAAIAGAIAGTAIVMYMATKPSDKARAKNDSLKTVVSPIDTSIFTKIVEKICDNIDNVIETYRVQIKRVENKYAQRQTPSLTTNYSILLEQIENVYNCSNVEGIPVKLKNAIDLLVDCLGNYNLRIENGKIINE